LLGTALFLTACAGGNRPQPVPPTPPKLQATTPAATAPTPQPAVKQPVPKEPAAAKPVPASGTYETVISDGDKLLLFGQNEYITILPDHLRLPARIDTGATTSSIHAIDIKKFERDGKKWVRFNLVGPDGRKHKLERPWIRTIEVKRHGTEQQVRPVVKFEVIMGPLKLHTQFSLTDRSQFKYPVLIGRSLLEGRAVVDVNRKFILSPIKEGERNAQ
jgi:hypothetical protein